MKLFDLLKHKSGQSIVEFALIVPILIVLLFAIIDISRLFSHYTLISNANKEALRLVSVGSSVDSIAGIIKNNLTPVLGASTFSIGESIDKEGNPCTEIILSNTSLLKARITPLYKNTLSSGDDISLTIIYNYKFVTPIKLFSSTGITLEVRYYTRLEAPPK